MILQVAERLGSVTLREGVKKNFLGDMSPIRGRGVDHPATIKLDFFRIFVDFL